MTAEDATRRDLLEVAARSGPARGRASAAVGDDRRGLPAADHGDYLPRSPHRRSSRARSSPRIDWEIDVAIDGSPASKRRGVFGAAYEGPPGYVHGGIIACAFDEMLGIANIAAGHPGMTARLTVHYRQPDAAVPRPAFPRRVDRVEGRRIMSRAEVWDGETLTAQAEGLFVQPRPELALEIFGPVT